MSTLLSKEALEAMEMMELLLRDDKVEKTKAWKYWRNIGTGRHAVFSIRDHLQRILPEEIPGNGPAHHVSDKPFVVVNNSGHEEYWNTDLALKTANWKPMITRLFDTMTTVYEYVQKDERNDGGEKFNKPLDQMQDFLDRMGDREGYGDMSPNEKKFLGVIRRGHRAWATGTMMTY